MIYLIINKLVNKKGVIVLPKIPTSEILVPELFSIKSFSQSLFNQEFFNIVHSNLKKNLVVYSYKKMCELLSFSLTSSSQKEKQFNIWKLYFNFSFNKTFKINYLYSKEKVYQNIFNFILDDYLSYTFLAFLNYYHSYSNQSSAVLSLSSLYEILGFVNPIYKLENPSYASSEDINTFGVYIESLILQSHYKKSYLDGFKKQIKLKHTTSLEKLQSKIQEEENKANGSYEADKFLKQQTDYLNSFTDKKHPFTYHLTNEQKKNFIYSPTYITLKSLYDFFSHSLPNIKYKINKLLERMELNNIISTSTLFVACKLEWIKNQDGESFYSFIKTPLPYSQISKYNNIVVSTCKQLNISSVNDLPYNSPTRKKYSSLLNSNIKKELGYDFIYSAIFIGFTPSNITFNSSSVSSFLKSNNSTFYSDLLTNSNKRFPLNNNSNKIYSTLFSLIANELIPTSFDFLDISLPALKNNALENLENNEVINTDLLYKDYSFPKFWLKFFSDSSAIVNNISSVENLINNINNLNLNNTLSSDFILSDFLPEFNENFIY